jgi:phospholipid/cholesterol/gamma-HCH transport system substrate-binding protein
MATGGSNYVKVGIFVTIGLCVAGALIFLIGDERHMFTSSYTLHSTFHDVAGLRVGGPVRMGGVDVGTVTAIRFGREPNDPLIHVDFTVVQESAVRIRRNSIARIVSKGLLGDKALEVTVGDVAQPRIANGSTLPSEESDEIGNALRNATTLLDRANRVMDNVVAATRPFASDQLGNEVLGLVHDLRAITNQVATGNGTVSRLIRDPTVADRIDGVLGSAQSAMRDVASATHEVQALARDARTGHGLVHALVYDEDGGRVVRTMGHAADELAAITHDVRTGNGGLHNVIYGNDTAQIAQNLNEATASIRTMLRDAQHGRGTLGMLLTDPSLYEDLRSLVGNVQRNEILRAMVRYSIHSDDRAQQRPVTAAPGPHGGGEAGASQPGASGGGAQNAP